MARSFGEFGIKLITPAHLDEKLTQHLREDYVGPDGHPVAVMNFRAAGNSLRAAECIPSGNRSLVYVTGWQRFVWAIEFVGNLRDAENATKLQRIPLASPEWPVVRLIRFLARLIPPNSGPLRRNLNQTTGVSFQPTQGMSYFSLSQADYERLLRSIPWTRPAQ